MRSADCSHLHFLPVAYRRSYFQLREAQQAAAYGNEVYPRDNLLPVLQPPLKRNDEEVITERQGQVRA